MLSPFFEKNIYTVEKKLQLSILLILSLAFVSCAGSGGDGGSGTEPNPGPEISSVQPQEGTVSMDVTIKGSGFSETSSDNVITFDGTQAPVDSAATDLLVTEVPEGASSGPIEVSVDGESVTGPSFTVQSTELQISSVSPEEGQVGTAITINGQNFGASDSTNTVLFNSIKAPVKSASESKIETKVPKGAKNGPVKVVVKQDTAVGPDFTIKAKAPSISSVDPDSGTVGTEIIISGMNFSTTKSENSITFNGTQATVKSASEDELITDVPKGATDGPVEVDVDQKSATGPKFDVITDGTIEINTNTTGSDKDTNGYLVHVDGSASQSVGMDDSIFLSDIEQGNHNVELTDIADNCDVMNSNPRLFEVTAGDTVSTQFEIQCQAKAKSKIAVTTFQQDIGNYEIFLINPDGSDPQRITNNSASELNPVVSNNGEKIAFSSDRNGDYDLYVMNSDGSNVQRLTQLNNLYIIRATWSPDDSKLAFNAVGSSGYQNIYSINADGTNMKLLTDDEGNDKLPSWSPDGSKIAFNSERFDASKEDYADGEDIFTVNADGGSIEFVTENDATNTNARWSPDGSKIIFVSNNNADNDVEIYEMDANGSNSTRLTNNSSSYDDHPSWSPDGTKIIFEGENGLYTVPSGGGGTAQKISNSDDFETPFWELVK